MKKDKTLAIISLIVLLFIVIIAGTMISYLLKNYFIGLAVSFIGGGALGTLFSKAIYGCE